LLDKDLSNELNPFPKAPSFDMDTAFLVEYSFHAAFLRNHQKEEESGKEPLGTPWWKESCYEWWRPSYLPYIIKTIG
jgi:hypothetical protein